VAWLPEQTVNVSTTLSEWNPDKIDGADVGVLMPQQHPYKDKSPFDHRA